VYTIRFGRSLTPAAVDVSHKTLVRIIVYWQTIVKLDLIDRIPEKGCPIYGRAGLTAQR
jgi:hypothetical protein